jgi:Domain of unknown function (DUF1963)
MTVDGEQNLTTDEALAVIPVAPPLLAPVNTVPVTISSVSTASSPDAGSPILAADSRPENRAKGVVAVGCAVMLLATVVLLNRNIGKVPLPSLEPVPVASAAASSPIAAPTPENTVVPPLGAAQFNPPVPQVPADLGVYQAELSSAARPVIAIDYTGLVNDPKPWSSHLFGPSDLPAGRSVPVDRSSQALCMVAQINLADLPKLPATTAQRVGSITALPATGVLQFWLTLAPVGSAAGWTGGPSFQATVNEPAQRVTYVSAADMAGSKTTSVPQSERCGDGAPARGPAVALAMNFTQLWQVPETTDARFDSALPFLAGALRNNADEFYRALGSINAWLGTESPAQIAGFNRLVSQDPRAIDSYLDEDTRPGLATDLFEVLFEIHTSEDPEGAWAVGFGAQGTGGWWVDPSEVAALTTSRDLPSAFWWESNVVPVEDEPLGE